MITITTDTWKTEKMSIGEFMWYAFDHYSQLEDKLFGKILDSSDKNETVDTNDFKNQLLEQIKWK